MTEASKKSSIQAINDILKAVVIAEHGAGTSPARLAVKLRPIDWNNLCDVARSAVAQASEEITSLRAERDALREENEKAAKLVKLCKGFVDKHRISCAEATAEDRVYENAPELVERIAKIVGFYEYPEDEE